MKKTENIKLFGTYKPPFFSTIEVRMRKQILVEESLTTEMTEGDNNW